MKAVSLQFGMQIAILIEEHCGALVSWGRPAEYNALVGGSQDPPSRHIDWDGIDASFLRKDYLDRYFAACKALGYFGYVKTTQRKGRKVFSCHIQRVAPRRRS
jgi:hypothetical protein